MMTVWEDARGMLLVDFLEEDEQLKGVWRKLAKARVEKHPGKCPLTAILHPDNASERALCPECRWEVTGHSVHFPGVTPLDS